MTSKNQTTTQPESHQSAPQSAAKSADMAQTEEVARENKVVTSNGNRQNPNSGKGGGAERGGPGQEKADAEQPPQSDDSL